MKSFITTYSAIVFFTLLFSSCNQNRIEELETSNHQFEQTIEKLNAQNLELREQISEMRDDMQTIQRYANSASQHANSAAFWSQSGDAFLFQSELRNMSSDFSNIVNITSKY